MLIEKEERCRPDKAKFKKQFQNEIYLIQSKYTEWANKTVSVAPWKIFMEKT